MNTIRFSFIAIIIECLAIVPALAQAAHFSPGERTAFKAAQEKPTRCWVVNTDTYGGTFCQFADGGSYKQFCFPDVWPGSSGKEFNAGNTRNCVKPAIIKKLMGPPPT